MKQIYGKNKGINIIETPKARPTDKKVLDSVMSMEYAKPFIDKNGKVEKLLVGGEFLDRNYNFIDNMVNTVFERKQYNNKPIGTITIFQGDVRIATNVLNKDGERAIGTRVSDVVYKRVIEEQGFWSSRAFVVTDWYLTAYEPIKNIDDKVIGILYVGLLERPFLSIKSAYFIALLFIVLVACVLSVILSFFLSRSIAGDMKKILITTNQIADGNLDIRIQPASDIKELNKLSEAVNNTAEKLSRREESLDITNRKLEILNKSYLDLIGFVTHELKGILSSIVMNTYLLKKGILGQLNDKQSSTINSIEKNLNYLSSTVKNFLNLSRIEKQQLELNKTSVLIKEHVFDTAIEAFKEQIKDKNMKLTNNIQENLEVNADPALMQIVANNLISNAVKYGLAGGQIIITSRIIDDLVEIEVYNDGQPIHDSDMERLFKKFSRIIYRGMEKTKGSGVGLYITKEILKMHSGFILAVPGDNGNSFIIQFEKD
jgi:two-component system NtrC family sensor kinase